MILPFLSLPSSGLGNVWRFPYLCYKHGGGAFLVPYALMLLFIGIPCFFLEISLGQYAAMGPVTLYSNLAPLFKGQIPLQIIAIPPFSKGRIPCTSGLGFANFLASCFVGLYYNMIIAWTIYYLFASFTSHLPWSDCNNSFNSECEREREKWSFALKQGFPTLLFSLHALYLTHKNCTQLFQGVEIKPRSSLVGNLCFTGIVSCMMGVLPLSLFQHQRLQGLRGPEGERHQRL